MCKVLNQIRKRVLPGSFKAKHMTVTVSLIELHAVIAFRIPMDCRPSLRNSACNRMVAKLAMQHILTIYHEFSKSRTVGFAFIASWFSLVNCSGGRAVAALIAQKGSLCWRTTRATKSSENEKPIAIELHW